MVGSILLDTILNQIGASELTLCDLALREGLALDYIHRNQVHIIKVAQYPDVRHRSVVELAERCNYSPEHAEQVGCLALSLFDQTRPAHSLRARERKWLEYASLLHDIGVHISYGRHHKHSYYLIKNGDLRGFEPEEVKVRALVARYHRRGLPKRAHRRYASLSQPLRHTVKVLSSLFRLSEGLDLSHQKSVESLEIIPGSQDCLVRIVPAGNTDLELWAARRSVASLERPLSRAIRFEVTNHAKQPESTTRVPRQVVRGRRHRRLW